MSQIMKENTQKMISVVATLAPDLNAAEFSHKYILKYIPEKLFSYGFINPKGSVLSIYMVGRTLAMIAAGTLVALPRFQCPQNKTNTDYWKFCFPVLANSEGLIFASLVAFLLGLFLSTTFARWWSCREKLGTVMNNIAYETMLLSNFTVAEESAQATSKTIIRWLNLAHALIYKQANRNFDYQELLEDKLLLEEEREKLYTYGNIPVMVLGWSMQALKDLVVQNKITPSVVGPSITCIGNCVVATQELIAFLDTQMPYAYLHLLAFLTKIHLIFVIFYGGGIIAVGIQDQIWTRIIFGYTVIIANNVIYEGLLHIHAMLVNPIGDDAGDFPKHIFMANTKALTESLQNL